MFEMLSDINVRKKNKCPCFNKRPKKGYCILGAH